MNDNESNNSYWIPMADLMTGLMMVFLLISAVFMHRVEKTTTLVVREYVVAKKNLNNALQQEFRNDMDRWNAKMLGDMTMNFSDPEVLFAVNSAELKPKFKEILNDFAPRYIQVITDKKFRDHIQELRIEGHTSTFWNGSTGKEDSYFKNMELSQRRTRTVLEYMLNLPSLRNERDWMMKHLTANGLSSSHPVCKIKNCDTSIEDNINQQASQRIEFRIVTDSDQRMAEIANGLYKQ